MFQSYFLLGLAALTCFAFSGYLTANTFTDIDLETLTKQRECLFQTFSSPSDLAPFQPSAQSGSKEDRNKGYELLAEGKVGCLVVAGGQGSRLGYEKPKGCYPISLIKNKSLFALLAEKVFYAGKQVGRPLYLAIMTSKQNHEETVSYFEEHNFFGLSSSQVFFFSQEELPLLDEQGNLLLDVQNHPILASDGNASSLKAFVSSGIFSTWQQAGVKYLNYLHIDNPLADPFDPNLTGFHENNPADVVIKCISREDPLEKLGVFFKQQDKVMAIEYSEISPEERDDLHKNPCANIGIYSFTLDFVFSVATTYYKDLPLHKAFKKTPEGPFAWKFERFIFDVIPYAKEVKALLYPRSQCFAPLKNALGDDTPFHVQKAMQSYDKEVFAHISGLSPEDRPFELSPAFYYPTQELLQKWKGKQLPLDAYISP